MHPLWFKSASQGQTRKRRAVHFSKDTAKALSAYVKARGFLAHEDAFFASKAGQGPTRNGVVPKGLRGPGEGLKSQIRESHPYLHTAATFWIKNGGDTVHQEDS